MLSNKYIFFSILILIIIFIIHLLFSSSRNTSTNKDLNLEEILKITSKQLSIFFLIYSILFLVGTFILLSLIIKKLKGKPILKFKEKNVDFPLDKKEAVKFLFFILSIVLIINILQIFLINLNFNPIKTALITNLILELGVIGLVLNFLSLKFLNFRVKPIHLISLTKLYLASLPLIFLAIVINNIFLKNFKIEATFNPAIKIVLYLKDNLFLTILVLQIILFGPLAEELFFRGFIYKLIRQKYKFLLSSILTSLFFASVHRTTQDILALFILSLVLCYIYEKTQNITTPFIFHSLHNFLSLIFLISIKNLI